jgi:hypothetical protein
MYVELKDVNLLITYHGQEKPLLQQDLGETHMVNKEFNESIMEIFTLKSKDLE